MIQAIIFDCFGVLLTDNLQIMREELAREDSEAASEVRNLVALVNKGVLHPVETRPKIAKLFGLDVDAYVEKVTSGEGKNYPLMDYILQLKTQYKIGMLSNIGSGSLLKRFTQAELDKHFDQVLASGDIGYAKPEREAYVIAAERLGVRLDACVFVDDREGFCEGATSVGMHAIVYKNFAQFREQLDILLADSK